MHEAALMRDVVSAVLTHQRHAGAAHVTGVRLEVGASSHLTEATVRQYFALLTAGTPAEGAALDITWLPAACWCPACRREFASAPPTDASTCPHCGGAGLELSHQDICRVSAITVVDEREPDASIEPDATQHTSSSG